MDDDKKMDEMPASEGHAMDVDPAPSSDLHAGMKMNMPMPASGAGTSGEPKRDHGGMITDLSAATRVTRSQRWGMALMSIIALVAGLVFSASFTNLRLSARDVGGAVMPPGMIMLRDTPGDAMRDMSAVDPRTVSYLAPRDARGDETLQPHLEHGIKVIHLDASVIKWNILPDKEVMGYAFNQQIPGPRIRVTEGDRVRIHVTNYLPESTTVHWHGLIVPNAMDGPAYVTQLPIEPGQTWTYEFATQQAGTYFYHAHHKADRQQTLGLYGALIIDPKDSSVLRGSTSSGICSADFTIRTRISG